MTQPSPSLLDAIAEVCKWHSRVELLNPSRKLRDGGRQAILPPEIPDAIRKGEIEVPVALIAKIELATMHRKPIAVFGDDSPAMRHPPGAVD